MPTQTSEPLLYVTDARCRVARELFKDALNANSVGRGLAITLVFNVCTAAMCRCTNAHKYAICNILK
jgi:hypothetical protein